LPTIANDEYDYDKGDATDRDTLKVTFDHAREVPKENSPGDYKSTANTNEDGESSLRCSEILGNQARKIQHVKR